MLSDAEIRALVEGQKGLFAQLNHTTIGGPVAVYNLLKVQQYWLVPLLLKTKVRGLTMLGLDGAIVSHGILYPNIQDENKLVDVSFFDAPPAQVLFEIKQQYKGYTMASPFFSYDGTPRKWGWHIGLQKGDAANPVTVFVAPQGWYEGKTMAGLEG